MTCFSCGCQCHNTTTAASIQPCFNCNCWNQMRGCNGTLDLNGPGPRVNVRSEIDYGPAILRALQELNEKLDKLVNLHK